VVVLSLSGEEELPEPCRRLLFEYPHLLLVVVTPDSNHGCVFRLVVDHMRLEEVSRESILAAIRREPRAETESSELCQIPYFTWPPPEALPEINFQHDPWTMKNGHA
jgi:hypothetical protein